MKATMWHGKTIPRLQIEIILIIIIMCEERLVTLTIIIASIVVLMENRGTHNHMEQTMVFQ